ncbi:MULTISPECIES: hypothetical protein [unclassified Streptomyces]|uniref:hypothetical protein n=1 Tax=unclassified Streptomyces TaxID=2593676 RepID=UPI00073C94EC|nr:hypothetical protein [Streptomyces sp. AVP053U2]ODA71111.1 hypothetical protein APS67_004617 [Streptomyces sp. AVP053U2]
MLFKFLMLLAASFLALVAPMIAATTTLAVPVFMLLLVAVIAATAVWSRDDARRENALKVLRMLLDSFFQKKK